MNIASTTKKTNCNAVEVLANMVRILNIEQQPIYIKVNIGNNNQASTIIANAYHYTAICAIILHKILLSQTNFLKKKVQCCILSNNSCCALFGANFVCLSIWRSGSLLPVPIIVHPLPLLFSLSTTICVVCREGDASTNELR